MIYDVEFRTKARNAKDVNSITNLDDKWLFTIDDLEKMAYNCGFKKVIINTLSRSRNLYRNYFAETLSTINLKYEELPNWAQKIVVIFDDSNYSYDSKDISLFSSIVLRKS